MDVSGMRFVVTGTEAGIGKTVFCAGLCTMLDAHYWKPVQCGLPADSEMIAELSGVPFFPTVYQFDSAALPLTAAAEASVVLDPDALIVPPGDDALIIEGGNLVDPLTHEVAFIDVFARWNLPLILCVRTTRDSIDNTLAALEAIRARNIPLLGVAFMGDADMETEAVITEKAR